MSREKLIPAETDATISFLWPEALGGLTMVGNEKNVLKQLSDSYLYKDILSLDKIHKPDKLIRLLQAIAYQLGSQVSYHELGQLCGLDSKTIEK